MTAQFNRNILTHVNQLCGGDFDVRSFRHLALWNGEASRMEMYLESRRRQRVSVQALGLRLTFEAGERLHTENSYKLTQEVQEQLLRAAGFEPEVAWLDGRGWFAVHMARAV